MNGDFSNQKTTKDFEQLSTIGGLHFRKKWNKTIGIILFAFAFVWTSICLYIFSDLFGNLFSKPIKTDSFELIFTLVFILVPVFFIMIGILMLFLGISCLLNSTDIHLNNNEIRIINGPVPLLRNKTISRSVVKQIFVKKVSKESNQPNATNICYINDKGESLFLTGSIFGIAFPFFKLEEALKIEQSIEQFFHIKNQDVSGAVNQSSESSYHETSVPLENYSAQDEMQNKKETEILLPHPASLQIEEMNHKVIIRKKWLSPVVIFYTIFTIMWNSFLGVAIYLLMSNATGPGKNDLNYFFLFLIPFFGVGIYLILNTIAYFVNTTYFEMDSTNFTIKHQPITIYKNYKIAKSELDFFDLTTKTRTTKNGYYLYYVLTAHFKNKTLKEFGNNNFMSLDENEVQYLKEKLNRLLKK